MTKELTKYAIGGLALLLVSQFFNCSRRDLSGSSSDPGSVSISLTVSSATGEDTFDHVDFKIAGNGIPDILGQIAVTGDLPARGSVEHVPAGKGYALSLSAGGTQDAPLCVGSTTFDVVEGKTTELKVALQCGNYPGGSVNVTGHFDNCPFVKSLAAVPSSAAIGETIRMTAVGFDGDGDALTYNWSQARAAGSTGTGDVGVFSEVAGAKGVEILTCASAGGALIKVSVSDGTCAGDANVMVTCVASSSGTGGGAGVGGGSGGSATASGGRSGAGGTTGTGGLMASGGGSGSGGAIGSGGMSTGGTNGTGGANNSGGAVGTGGANNSGGAVGTGGANNSGGAVGTGGVNNSGGAVGTGGVNNSGGAVGTGGVEATGGMVGTGGAVPTGGTLGTGGVTPTGGAPGTGGSGTGGAGTGGADACLPTHCPGSTCDTCTADNCVPSTDGCDGIADIGDKALCEAAYACFVDPENNCVNQGDPLKCWCGSHPTTCVTSNTPGTQADGPCLQQVFAAAKSTDAATIKQLFVNPSVPLGRAVNLTSCRGTFCNVECSVP